MKRTIFFVSICLIISTVFSADGDKKIASVNGDDIKAFRTKYYEEPIDELNDLNPKSDDVIGIFDKIKELENKGFDMLNMLPDVECTCCTQFKFYITTTIARAKEQTDYCVAKSVNKENRREMNIEQKNCTLDALQEAKKQIDGMTETIGSCRLLA